MTTPSDEQDKGKNDPLLTCCNVLLVIVSSLILVIFVLVYHLQRAILKRDHYSHILSSEYAAQSQEPADTSEPNETAGIHSFTMHSQDESNDKLNQQSGGGDGARHRHAGSSVELLVMYQPSYFLPESRPEIRFRGEHGGENYVRCRIRGLVQGWTKFEAVVAKLEPLFFGGRIGVIRQDRGTVNGVEVAAVTSPSDDFDLRYCSVDGEESLRKDVHGSLIPHDMTAGEDVLLVGGGRRTILRISR